jgi:hypothetical protein
LDRRHAGRLAFEVADQVSHVPEHPAILLPFADDFGFEGVFAWIKIRPEFRHGLRWLSRIREGEKR